MNFNPPLGFRVIDTRTGKVVEECYNKHAFVSHPILPSGKLEAPDFLIPSAAIGIKDSKGVEIYASDVLMCGENCKEFGVVKYDKDLSAYRVLRLTGKLKGHKFNITFVPIIGNIYEPEFKQYLNQLERA
jgi:hypothetical protein